MALKKFKPTTPGQRGLQLVDRSELFKGKPWRSLTKATSSSGGRNNSGRITVRGRGGGHKRRIRIVDFRRREFLEIPAIVERIEYDPGRTAFIALLKYTIKDGEKESTEMRYIVAPQKLKVGDSVLSSMDAIDTQAGNSMPIAKIPVGTIIHNIELKLGKGGQMARSAGQFAQIVGRDDRYVLVRIASGEIRKILDTCFATCGAVSNPDHSNIRLAKAGRNRWKGFRPISRGVARNPVDHPMGGGEGKSSGGRHPSTPWGKPTKGYRTRRNKTSDRIIVRSRHKK